jgi:3-dehydroquinate synthase
MAIIHVPLKTTIDDSYDIEIGERLFERLIADLSGGLMGEVHRYALITDSNVRRLYGEKLFRLLGAAGLNVSLFAIPAGEKSKTREMKANLEDRMIGERFGRDSAVIALGGGVVSDLAGFLAGTFARGIKFINFATTLLAAADASVGGKTAIDTPQATNLIGLFHQPKKVYIDTTTWDTLPVFEIQNGLAETVKHACLGDRDFFDFLEKNVDKLMDRSAAGRLDRVVCARIAGKNCEIKYRVVERDVGESNLRQVLNLGHTLGRALEPLLHYSLGHGEAVAIGLMYQMRLGRMFGYVGNADVTRVQSLFERIGLPTRIPPRVKPALLIEKMYTDKKVRKDSIRFVFQKGIGAMMRFEGGGYSRPVTEIELKKALEESY